MHLSVTKLHYIRHGFELTLLFSILKGDTDCLQRTQHYAKQYQDNMEVLNKIGMTDAVSSPQIESLSETASLL